MARRRQRLFKYGPANVVQLATRKVEASRDIWASNTVTGFNQFWSDYITGFAQRIAPVVQRLPAKTTDIRANVNNRVAPVAIEVSNYAREYRNRRLTRVVGAIGTPPTGG